MMEPENLQNWDALIAQCSALQGLTDPQRTEAVAGFTSLRRHLGEEFLRESFPKRHPIHANILNQAPWTRVWIAHLGRALDRVSASPGIETVVRRLSQRESFADALSILTVGARFHESGCSVEFEVPVTAKGKARVPDLLVRREGLPRVYVEHASLLASADEAEAQKTTDTLFDLIWRGSRGLHWAFRIHRTLSERRLQLVVAQVREAVSRANESRSLQVVQVPDVLDLGMAGDEGLPALHEWAASVDLKVNSGDGPGSSTDHIRRILSKLKDKKAQVPEGELSLIIVTVRNPLFRAWEIAARIAEFEEKLYGEESVSGLLVAWRVVRDFHLAQGFDVAKHPHTFVVDAGIGTQGLLLDNFLGDRPLGPDWCGRIADAARRNLMSLHDPNDRAGG